MVRKIGYSVAATLFAIGCLVGGLSGNAAIALVTIAIAASVAVATLKYAPAQHAIDTSFPVYPDDDVPTWLGGPTDGYHPHGPK